ncbi:P-loop containing nucleoside triphosphate hydrolase protein [Abortiporus biennis]|nr:P-loop containing nucleoside triphosphate hydrolase protein [Abortiporus biennis]
MYLRDYQRDGVKFFWDRYEKGVGGVLGDDMGLGKTIQIISFLSAIMLKTNTSHDINRRRNHVNFLQDTLKSWKKERKLPKANETWPTALIIAPSSVVGNWERELEKWGYFETGVYMGSPADRKDVLKEFKMGRLDLVLTSFELARKEISVLEDLPFSVVIVDEAHRIKNKKSKLTEAFERFGTSEIGGSTVRFGVSGTIIQNSYSEMWTILDWTTPGCVGSKKQWEGFVNKPLTVGMSKCASEDEHLKGALVARILKDKILPQCFLRRTKDIIKDQLPRKTDEVVFCPLTSQQIYVYKRILKSEPVQNMLRKDEQCECGSREKRGKCCHPYEKGDLFKYITTLIKVSNHLALILSAPNDSAEQVIRNRELTKIAFPREGDVPTFGTAMLQPRLCGKWMVLQTLLKEWHKDKANNKVLIFTKSVKLLDMLEFQLQTQGLGFVKLDGSTKQSERMTLIDKFHEDASVFIFLISTLAGGTGLNLTGANKVVIFDPNWNPAHDLQAMDRAYRFGQTRDVSVYRLLGAGSIEELIYARQVYKQQQMAVGYNASLQTRYFEGVQGDTDRKGELFGIKNLFKLHEDTLATKMAIEKATLGDLDWALANMDGKLKKPTAGVSSDWINEAVAKGGKEMGDLRGLGALLFDDSTPEIPQEETDIQKILNGVGVNYTHRNENLIKDNAVEEQRIEKALQEKRKVKEKAKAERKKRASKSKSKSPDPVIEWPPKRRHHAKALSPESKLIARQKAMIELGFISGPNELSAFAQEFTTKSNEEQIAILARLDQHATKNRSGR